MATETGALLRQIRRWLLVVAFLLGVGIVTLAHAGYVATAPHLLYWQRLVFSATGATGGAVALVAGVKLLGSVAPTGPSSE